MAYFTFAMAEAFGFLVLFLTYKGVFSLPTACLVAALMLALGFHVLVRKPSANGVRMACFTYALWLASFMAMMVFFEFRSATITLGAGGLFLVTAVAAGFATYSLIPEPEAHFDIDA